MFLGSRARPVRRADNLTAICDPIVGTTWDPRHLTTLQASTAYYGDSFIVLLAFCCVRVCTRTLWSEISQLILRAD
jgi:hypothetical protein